VNTSPPNSLRDLAAAVQAQHTEWKLHAQVYTVRARSRDRGRAAVTDVTIFLVLGFLIIIGMIRLTGEDYDGPPWLEARGAWIFDLALLVAAMIHLATEALFGVTLGKLMNAVRVVPRAHGPMLFRWYLKILPLVLSALIALVGLRHNSEQRWRTFTPTFLNSILPDWLIPLTLLTMIVAAFFPVGVDRRPWYGHVAGTLTVRGHRTRPRGARGFDPIFPSQSQQ
jgi:hypothetical protein